MKKARIFLTALAVVAVAGGAIAFKAKQLFWYAQCDIPNQVCTLHSFQTFVTTDQNGVYADFDVYGKPCFNNECITLTVFIN